MKRIKFLLLLSIIAFVPYCTHKDSKALFYNQALQDSLYCYITNIHTIPNPINAPTVINVLIGLSEKNDTIVSFIGYCGFVYPVDENMEMAGCRLGGYRYDDKYIVVHSDNYSLAKSIIDTDCLVVDKKIIDNLEAQLMQLEGFHLYPISRRVFSVTQNAVTLLQRVKGEYENSF